MTSKHAVDSRLSTAKTASAALRTFLNIARAWKLDEGQAMTLLGFDEKSRSTYFKWKRGPETARINRDKLERLSLHLRYI